MKVALPLLRNSRKTVAGWGAPPQERASSFLTWWRASAPFALILSALVAGPLVLAAEKSIGNNVPDRQPVLLELFTSEGCSSCPPADKLLQSLDKSQPIAGADLIVLSEHVDYWNHGGWSDPYSSPAFSARQRDYAAKLGLESVYTPQLVVDGTSEVVGSNAVEARSAIAEAVRAKKIPISLMNAAREKDRVTVHVDLQPSGFKGKNAVVYLALADSENHSQVSRGENAGRSLVHVAVVRSLMAVGNLSASGFSKDVSIPVKSSGQNGLRIVAFVQDSGSRKVLGVAQQKL